MSNEVFALFHTELDTILSHFFVICLDGLERVLNLLRNYGLAEFYTLSESLVAEDWHYSWNNLAFYSFSSAIIDPLIEEIVVIEELCYNEVCTRINLLFKEANVVLATLCF